MSPPVTYRLDLQPDIDVDAKQHPYARGLSIELDGDTGAVRRPDGSTAGEYPVKTVAEAVLDYFSEQTTPDPDRAWDRDRLENVSLENVFYTVFDEDPEAVIEDVGSAVEDATVRYVRTSDSRQYDRGGT